MTNHSRTAFGLVFVLCGLLAATGSAHAIFIKGAVGPGGEVCRNAGGTISGNMCVLESGQSCEATTLAIQNKCVDEDGNIIDDGPDFGSNLPPDESNGESDSQ